MKSRTIEDSVEVGLSRMRQTLWLHVRRIRQRLYCGSKIEKVPRGSTFHSYRSRITYNPISDGFQQELGIVYWNPVAVKC